MEEMATELEKNLMIPTRQVEVFRDDMISTSTQSKRMIKIAATEVIHVCMPLPFFSQKAAAASASGKSSVMLERGSALQLNVATV